VSLENQVAIVNKMSIEQAYGRTTVKPAVVIEVKSGNRYDLQISGISAIVPEVQSVFTETTFKVGDAVLVECPLGNEHMRQIISPSVVSIPEETIYEFSTKPKERPVKAGSYIHATMGNWGQRYTKFNLVNKTVVNEFEVVPSPTFVAVGQSNVYLQVEGSIRKYDLNGNLIAEKGKFLLVEI